MTFARWRQDGFDVGFVADLLKKEIRPITSSKGLQYSGTAFFDDPLTLLESGVEFLEPLSDLDRSSIIWYALEAALRSSNYGPSTLIKEINKATRDFARLPEIKYVVATGLSFRHFEDFTKIESPDYRLYVRQRFPPYLVKSHNEAKHRSKAAIRGDYPEEIPSKSYAAAWLHVRGRSASEAMQRAVEALDLYRGIWNFALNRGSGIPFPAPIRGPLNEILAGPLYSLHSKDGSLATANDWFEPEYTEPVLSRNLQRKWGLVRKDDKDIRNALKLSSYKAVLEDALRRYCRALDSPDLSSSFLNLWSLLETLTGIAPQDGHDKMVKRASFIYADTERKTHEQVLQHLRRYRNSYVHAGEGSEQTGTYLHQLRVYTERLLEFHLRNSHSFTSLEQTSQFLDLPADISGIKHMIKTQEQTAEAAKEAARLAVEGLRFHSQSPT